MYYFQLNRISAGMSADELDLSESSEDGDFSASEDEWVPEKQKIAHVLSSSDEEDDDDDFEESPIAKKQNSR